MARKQCCPDSGGDIPTWFMTYSDVITLLMTFFILLLTFATNEPERFERMQLAMFGGGGSDGLAGPHDGNLSNESLMLRVRPVTARLSQRGSETAPMYTDPVKESLANGLQALENANDLARAEQFRLDVALNVYFDREGNLTPLARQQLKMLAIQMHRMNLSMHLEVGRTEDVDKALKLGQSLVEEYNIPPGRVKISVAPRGREPVRGLRMIVTRQNQA
ncbi:flagellar motor protein MotB [Maioricimonas rarisocia]|uniref:Flagellar motor protein MotB n=1 Tax=Maioricimonas rarisocia TaxID=2528026 RepID=A0A517ZCL8_9PLAN|nr:flagellar motor protein MotB [Maioricimonas rarisocia]QDU40243.1 flagellar motor protein MotB [Maioricimonas rarisocia]